MMRRRYKAEYYHDLIHRIKSAIPDCGIGVDVIVGFPGETDTHFEETFQFLHGLPVSYLHVFSYSERENTPAAEYSAAGQSVPMHIRAERSKRLRTLSAKKKFEFYRSQCGLEKTIIPETRNEATGQWVGWTENYVRTEFVGQQTTVQKPVLVRLLETDGETVQSELLGNITPFAPQQQPSYIPIIM